MHDNPDGREDRPDADQLDADRAGEDRPTVRELLAAFRASRDKRAELRRQASDTTDEAERRRLDEEAYDCALAALDQADKLIKSTVAVDAAIAASFVESFADQWAADHLATRLSCFEVDAFADVLDAFGAPKAADMWIGYHAEDDDSGDLHYDGPDPDDESDDEEDGRVASS